MGDEILKQFAGELRAQFHPDDTVARWGGDEFVAIVTGRGKGKAPRVPTGCGAGPLASIRSSSITRPLLSRWTPPVGATAWNGVESGPELFARADKEMYRAKQHSRQLARA